LVRRKLEEVIDLYNLKNGKLMLNYGDEYRKSILEEINLVSKETGMLMNLDKAYRIFMAVKNTQKIEGDIAEFGVYTGGSAKIIWARAFSCQKSVKGLQRRTFLSWSFSRNR
jgi:hypothetical protein